MQIFEKQSMRTSETLVKDVDYKEVVDGNNTPFKVVNLDNPKYAKRNGYAELTPMRFAKGQQGMPKHDNYKTFTKFVDRKTGLIWGIPIGINPTTKELIWKRFHLEGNQMFDLSDWDQAALFAIVKNSVFCEGSPNLLGKPSYKVRDKVAEAETSVKKVKLRRQAEDIILSFNREQMREAAINLGVNLTANSNPEMLEAEVFRVSGENPSLFLTMWNNPNREYTSIFKRALADGIIIHNIQTLSYMYNGVSMGQTEEAAVKYLFDNKGVASTINIIIKDNERRTIESMQTTDYVKPVKVETPEEPIVYKDPFDKLNAEPNKSLEELRAEAKELGIKGYGVMKEEALIKKISEISHPVAPDEINEIKE